MSIASGMGVHAVAVPEALETLELLPGNREPLAQNGRASLGAALGVLQQLGLTLLDLRQQQAALVILDELDLDARDAIDEGGANLDDLKLYLDKLKMAVGVLLARADVEAVSEPLGLGGEPMGTLVVPIAVMIVVIAMFPMAIMMAVLPMVAGPVVISMVSRRLLLPLVPIDDLRRREDAVQGIARGIQFEAVDKKTVVIRMVVNGESQFEMARVADIELDAFGLVPPASYQNRTAGTF